MKRVIEVAGVTVIVALAGVGGYVLERIALLTASRVVLTTLVVSTVTMVVAGAFGILLAVERVNRRS